MTGNFDYVIPAKHSEYHGSLLVVSIVTITGRATRNYPNEILRLEYENAAVPCSGPALYHS